TPHPPPTPGGWRCRRKGCSPSSGISAPNLRHASQLQLRHTHLHSPQNRTATVRERTERTSSQAPESAGAPMPLANTHILRPEGAKGCSHGWSEAAPAAERNPWNLRSLNTCPEGAEEHSAPTHGPEQR